MTIPPREPKPGDRISADWGGALARHAKRTAPVAGPGMRARVTPGGTVISCRPARGPRAHVARPRPYEARIVDEAAGTAGAAAHTLHVYLPEQSLVADGADVPFQGGAAGALDDAEWMRFAAVAMPADGAEKTVWAYAAKSGGSWTGGISDSPPAAADALLPVCTIENDGVSCRITRQLACGVWIVDSAADAAAAPQKWYNVAEITTGAAGGQHAGDPVVKVSRVAAFSGALLVTGDNTELPLDEDMTVYLHVVLTVGTGGTLTGTVTPVSSKSAGFPLLVPYTGSDYYIPIWHVSDGKLYDATIPGMTKRI